MNKKIVKLNRKLQAVAITTFLTGVMLSWLVYRSYKTFEKPVPGMRVTFEMYQAQSEIFQTLAFQLLPMLAVLFFLIGFVIFYCLRKRSQFDKESFNENALPR
jgi:hypothetical protein